MTLDEIINRSVDEIIVKESFEKKLKEGKLRVKMGFDPTKPDLHLGHLVGLRVLKKLQDAGHTIVFIIGDYTAKIGDPSGRNTTRPVLTDEEIKKNADTYFDQVGKILDISKAEIKRNSSWHEKLTFAELIKLSTNFTVAQIIERDDFSKRLKDGNDIGFNELFYPLMQAYDSIEVRADVEFGGTDQKFNMLTGRDLQKKMGQTPQEVVTIKLLVGLDGKNKMSKSLGNYVALNDTATDMYGKIMSIPDSIIVDYYKLCTEKSDKEIEDIENKLSDGDTNPRDIKADLALEITKMYNGEEEAKKAQKEFENVFKNKENPEDIKEIEINDNEIRIDDLLVKLELSSSKSEAKRLVEQGGVMIDNEKITDSQKNIEIKNDIIIKAGKRNFVKIKSGN
jgi:tyrosyl-tRNA synthetase